MEPGLRLPGRNNEWAERAAAYHFVCAGMPADCAGTLTIEFRRDRHAPWRLALTYGDDEPLLIYEACAESVFDVLAEFLRPGRGRR